MMERRSFIMGTAASVLSPFSVRGQNRQVIEVLSGDRLTVDGEEFMLADIMAPPLYTMSGNPPPYFNEARASLSALVSNDIITFNDVLPETRWGVRRVHASLADGTSLQSVLVKMGAAQVAPASDEHDVIEQLLRLEAEPRARDHGMWAQPGFQILDARFASPGIGAYRLVEGDVVKVADTRSRFYLNFGADYKTDFTASATKRTYNKWARAGFDLAQFEGRRVLVRGFMNDINGPSIELVHPHQLMASTENAA